MLLFFTFSDPLALVIVIIIIMIIVMSYIHTTMDSFGLYGGLNELDEADGMMEHCEEETNKPFQKIFC